MASFVFKIPDLYDHQQKIIQENKLWTGLWHGTGGGKTRTLLELSEGPLLIICPKQQKLDQTWERNAVKFGIDGLNMTVMSKEEFRRDWKTLGLYKTVIIDECHNFLGVTASTIQKNYVKYPKTSQIFEATRQYLLKYPPKRFYMCSATPVSKPMHLWAIATLFGKNWDWFKFREKYYFELNQNVWVPRTKTKSENPSLISRAEELRERLAELTKSFGYTGTLNDWFDVPDQVHKTVYIDLTKEQISAIKEVRMTEADPLLSAGKIRTIENGLSYTKKIESISSGVDKLVKTVDIFPSGKIDYILQRAEEFPKMLIFATYTAQIAEIASKLTQEGFKVVTLTGKTKDRKNLIAEADASQACIVIAQSSISEGYELPSFPCVIYASKSYRFCHYEQSLGRVLRSNALKKNLYIHLITPGGSDEDCHKAILSGANFQEKVMEQDELDTDSDIV